MNQLHTPMRFGVLRELFFGGFAGLILLGTSVVTSADETTFTRVYQLKHVESAACISALNFAVADTAKKRILSGQGKKLVVTDIGSNQDEIAQLLPIIDQPGKETDPRRAHMEVIVRVTNFLNSRAQGTGSAGKGSASAAAPSASAPVITGNAQTYDAKRSTQPYKSVYSDEDVKLMTKPREIKDDPVLPAITNLQLKGIFLISSKRPMALLTYENSNFTARDGGLYYFNRTLMKGYTTKVLKDRVVITGQDRIPREVKFKSSI